ncbi:MAG TPA: sugar phosphate isomerase/epimerase [Blastocatellia bacterium]|nr:sugar phosphate isomerase/epimerase [Blastocatellia bacterium]
MRLGVFTPLFGNLGFEDMLEKVKEYGLDCIELGTGNYPGNDHLDLDGLLESASRRAEYLKKVSGAGLAISALSCHGNPVHPNTDLAKKHHDTFRKTVLLAEAMEVPVVVGFSGCPGDSAGAKNPNWVTCAWPPDYLEILDWQWNEVLIPYWIEQNKYLADHGIKMALEMHPGFNVYNPETLLRLRSAAGPQIGANLDPSHLFWQGIEIPTAIKRLGRDNAIFYFHAKDTSIDKQNTAENGVLDVKSYARLVERSWIFRSVGWGHDMVYWREVISALRTVGYDYVLSIEHEDALASSDEGLKKSVEFLKEVVLREQPAQMWWA